MSTKYYQTTAADRWADVTWTHQRTLRCATYHILATDNAVLQARLDKLHADPKNCIYSITEGEYMTQRKLSQEADRKSNALEMPFQALNVDQTIDMRMKVDPAPPVAPPPKTIDVEVLPTEELKPVQIVGKPELVLNDDKKGKRK